MNNWIGLLIALSLAVLAGVLNWKYLEGKAQEIEMVSFLVVAENRTIEPGKAFHENDFAEIEIPRKSVGYLQNAAVHYRDRHTVVGMKAVHEYKGGEMVMHSDLQTPPDGLQLKKGEVAIFIPVNSNSFVPSLVKPGDEISFSVPKSLAPDEPNINQPPDDPEMDWDDRAFDEDGNPRQQRAAAGPTEILGPFRVLSLGGRLSSFRVSRAAGGSSSRENVIGIAVQTVNKLGQELEPQAQKLDNLAKQSNSRQISVVLRPKTVNSE